MATATTVKTFIADTTILNEGITPFNAGNHILAFSAGTPIIYGVNSPAHSNTAKFFTSKQTVSGNKAFPLGSALNTPVATLTAANVLRGVAIVGTSTAPKRTSGAAIAAGGTFIFAVGGGTAAGDATYVVDGVQAIAAVSIQVKSSGVNTKTILVGDKINIAGDTTDYYALATSVTFNGTTAVAVSITPPLVAATGAASVVTVTAADGKTAIIGTAPSVGQTVKIWVMDAADVIAITTLVASTPADIEAYDAMSASAAASIYAQAKG